MNTRAILVLLRILRDEFSQDEGHTSKLRKVSQGLKHTQVLLEKEYFAINSKFDKLITSLMTAVASEYTLDKEATSFDDLLDVYRMSLRYYYVGD